MFATVTIDTKGSQEEKVIAVPQEAVLMDGAARYVFVQTAPDMFKREDIKVGRTFGKKIEVTEGLKEGDAIVGKGSFVLKSELKKEELEGE
jgi:cobalt-zinc-cadmium efflux system membrane fusion protein